MRSMSSGMQVKYLSRHQVEPIFQRPNGEERIGGEERIRIAVDVYFIVDARHCDMCERDRVIWGCGGIGSGSDFSNRTRTGAL